MLFNWLGAMYVTDHINLLLPNFLLDFPISNPIHGLIPEFPEQTRHLHVECFVCEKFITPTPLKGNPVTANVSRHCLLDLKNLHLRFSNSRRIILGTANFPQIIYYRDMQRRFRNCVGDIITERGIRVNSLQTEIGSDI